MARTTEYSEIYRDELVAILRQNVPKYFSERDVTGFQKYLSEKKWDGHDVFVGQDHEILGCASYYVKCSSVVGLSWMFFTPFRIGSHRLLPGLEEYLASIRIRVGATDSE